MAQTTWKQVVYDTADAYREASKTTDKIPVGQLANLIRQGAGGEDVTEEVTEYETLLETAIANLAGKAFQPPIIINEGQYVWKKCEYVPPVTVDLSKVTLTASRPTTTQIKITSTGFDITTLSDECYKDFFNGLICGKSGSKPRTFGLNTNGELVLTDYSTDAPLSWDSSSSTLTFIKGNAISLEVAAGSVVVGTGGNVRTLRKEEIVFLDYVVSDDPTAYPDSGEQDGYWYERVSEGVDLSLLGISKIAIDTFTFSTEKQAKNTSIAHSLGEIPKLAYVQTANITKGNYERIIRMIVITSSFGVGHGGTIEIGATEFLDSSNSHGASHSTFNATPTAQNLVFYGSNGYYQAGKEYTLITMA